MIGLDLICALAIHLVDVHRVNQVQNQAADAPPLHRPRQLQRLPLHHLLDRLQLQDLLLAHHLLHLQPHEVDLAIARVFVITEVAALTLIAELEAHATSAPD